MPVPKEELTEQRRPLDERVMTFLLKNRGEAFTVFEIAQGVERYTVTIEILVATMMDRTLLNKYQAVLALLLLSKKIEAGEVRGATFYAAR